MWNVLDAFSKELRRQCALKGSISQVCKGTGINRQQFNKYLAGQALPSARNMRKICIYLGVTEAQLMSAASDPTSEQTASRPRSAEGVAVDDNAIDLTQLASLIAARLGAISGEMAAGQSASPLCCGQYDVYLPLYAGSDTLVRWLLDLRPIGNGLTFTCRTYVGGVGSPRSAATRNKYRGVGIAGARDAYLLGTSRMHLHQPGIIAVSMLAVQDGCYFAGLSLTPRLDGPVAVRAALRYRGEGRRARAALAELGMIKLSDPALDPVIARMMGGLAAGSANPIAAAGNESLRADDLTGGSEIRHRPLAGRLAV